MHATTEDQALTAMLIYEIAYVRAEGVQARGDKQAITYLLLCLGKLGLPGGYNADWHHTTCDIEKLDRDLFLLQLDEIIDKDYRFSATDEGLKNLERLVWLHSDVLDDYRYLIRLVAALSATMSPDQMLKLSYTQQRTCLRSTTQVGPSLVDNVCSQGPYYDAGCCSSIEQRRDQT